MAIKIITTADGSHSLFKEELDETYHSIHGAIQESKHVFIQNGLKYAIQKNPSERVSILEIGFGTGLNALLTLQYVQQLSIKINYTTVEPWPLTKEVWSMLNYSKLLNQESCYWALHEAEWDQEQSLHSNFEFLKLRQKLEDTGLPKNAFGVVYYDAFAPSKQPELWELPVLEKISEAMSPGGIFVTYCAKGELKRNLRAIGFTVETLSGPPGKKEMVRGIK